MFAVELTFSTAAATSAAAAEVASFSRFSIFWAYSSSAARLTSAEASCAALFAAASA